MTEKEHETLIEDMRQTHNEIRARVARLDDTMPRYATVREQFTHAEANLDQLTSLVARLKDLMQRRKEALPSSVQPTGTKTTGRKQE